MLHVWVTYTVSPPLNGSIMCLSSCYHMLDQCIWYVWFDNWPRLTLRSLLNLKCQNPVTWLLALVNTVKIGTSASRPLTARTRQPAIFLYHTLLFDWTVMSSNWSTGFKVILEHYQQDVLTSKSKHACKRVIKKIRKAIVKAHKEQGDDEPLPTSLKKVTII